MDLINETSVKNGYSKSVTIIDDMISDKYTLSYSCERISTNSFLTMYTTSKDNSRETIIIPIQFAGDNSIEIEFSKDIVILDIIYKGSTLNSLELSTVVTPYMEFIQVKATLWDKIQDIVNENNKVRADMMEGIINLTLNAFANDGGTITQENGVMTFLNGTTQEYSTQAVQITGGAIRVASKRNEDGTWDWKTAITGAGINAECINAGVLNGMWVEGGQINGSLITGCMARFGVPEYAYTEILPDGNLVSFHLGKKTIDLKKSNEGRLELGQDLSDTTKPAIYMHSVADIPFVNDDPTSQAPQGSSIRALGEGLDISYGDTHIILYGGGVHIYPEGAGVTIHGDLSIEGQITGGGLSGN